MITWRGFSYGLLTVLAYLILAYSGFSFLFVFFFVLLILPPLSAIQLLIAGRYLQIIQSLEADDVERGDQARLTVRLVQKGWLSHGELDLVIRKPGQYGQTDYERHRQVLLAGIPVDLSCPIDCRHRGQYAVGISSIRSRDILGLFYLPIRTRAACRNMMRPLRVIPKPANISGIDELTSQLADWQHQQTLHIGDEIDAVANLRAHRPGDSLKRTHWKVSARLNEVMIKEFENPLQREGMLILDLERTANRTITHHGDLELGDFYMDCAAFLSKMVLSTGNHLRLVTYQHDGRHDHLTENFSELRALQYILTEFEWSKDWPADQVLAEETTQNHSAWFILLLTTKLNHAMAGQLQVLHNRGLLIWLILIDEQPDDAEQAQALSSMAALEIPCLKLDRHERSGHGS